MEVAIFIGLAERVKTFAGTLFLVYFNQPLEPRSQRTYFVGFCLDVETSAVAHVGVVWDSNGLATGFSLALIIQFLPERQRVWVAHIVDGIRSHVFIAEDDVAMVMTVVRCC